MKNELNFLRLYFIKIKRKYQKYHHLKETGVIDADTSKLISTPRCGLPDLRQFDNTKIASIKCKS